MVVHRALHGVKLELLENQAALPVKVWTGGRAFPLVFA
jgi:hypothetical protein